MTGTTSGPGGARPPAVSIVLPTYNRAAFLPAAFASIRAQEWDDWELIVVDDGSTDPTRQVVAGLAAGMPGPVRYVAQENRGAYGARNTGLDLARGESVAFFDSDDLWLPHHLRACAGALAAHPEVDWVYGASRMVDYATGAELAPSTFYVDGRPRPFLGLRTRPAGRLRIIDDPKATRTMILDGLFCGLQNSVIRRRVFADQPFRVRPQHEAEDQLAVIRAVAAGYRLAYFDDVHVVYHVHPGNSSAAAPGGACEKTRRITEQLVAGLEELGREVRLTPAQRRALGRRLGREYFWVLGYALLWQGGRRREALALFRRGLRAWPWAPGPWKTYALALLRTALTPGAEPRPDSPVPARGTGAQDRRVARRGPGDGGPGQPGPAPPPAPRATEPIPVEKP
jgi:glycosyltransferase involved in cell wall biosynthesis